jgi:hypothetical protein
MGGNEGNTEFYTMDIDSNFNIVVGGGTASSDLTNISK